MAQIASIASLAGAGASIFGNVRQGQQQQQQAREAAVANAERQRQLEIQRQAEARSRSETLERTIASTRARMAASGIRPDEGSAAALAQGFRRDAQNAEADSDALFRSRLAAGRRSLLASDGSFNSFLRAGQGFGSAVRSLIE
jgi:hypothetical protein